MTPPTDDTPGPEHEPRPAGSGISSDEEREAICQAYLNTDYRRAIRHATAPQLRQVLSAICESSCKYLRDDIGGYPPLGGDFHQPWRIFQATGVHTGLQLYRYVLQGAAGRSLQALGMDPARATAEPDYLALVITPDLAAARPARLRHMLVNLLGQLTRTVRELDKAAAASANAAPQIPDDLWQIAAGTQAGVDLCRHVARVIAVEFLSFTHKGLGVSSAPAWPHFDLDADAVNRYLN